MTNKEHWSEGEKAKLLEWWNTASPIRLWQHLIPEKTKDAIMAKARRMKLGKRPRDWKPTYVQSWECIKQVLSDGKAYSVPELAKKTGFNASVVRKQMRDRVRLQVYVSAWRFETNKHVALFSLGANKPNVRKPKPKTAAQVQSAYYRRTKRNRPELIEAKNKQRRLSKSEARTIAPVADLAASWLFNPTSPC